MNPLISIYISGIFIKFFGLLMIIPVICSLIYGENDYDAFLLSALFTTVFGYLMELFTRPADNIREIDKKNGFLIVSLCWISAGLFGSLPYMIEGVFSSPADAFFESVSGFTTTGATVIPNPEILTHGIQFWRNFTQWLGGMGIILLAIAILPRLSVGGMQLMGHEVSEHKTEKITPRIAETAKKLWFVYILLSIIIVLLLFLAGMPFFDSVLHSFTTIATGGFSNKAESVGSYGSAYIDVITTFFMFVGGINFALIYYAMLGGVSRLFKSSDFRCYLLLNLGAILLLTFMLSGSIYSGFFESLRYSAFQVISISTGTGYSSADYDLWSTSSQYLLLLLMFLGACAGSTTGGLKSIRVLVLLKTGYREIKKHVYPHGVFPVRIDNQAVDEKTVSSVMSFFILYIFLTVVSAAVLFLLEDLEFLSAVSASAASIGTVGPGLGEFGPMENYSFLGADTKVFLSLLMVVGRLELYAMLVLITPEFWKK